MVQTAWTVWAAKRLAPQRRQQRVGSYSPAGQQVLGSPAPPASRPPAAPSRSTPVDSAPHVPLAPSVDDYAIPPVAPKAPDSAPDAPPDADARCCANSPPHCSPVLPLKCADKTSVLIC